MATLFYTAKFDPFLSFDCSGLEGVGRDQILPSGNLAQAQCSVFQQPSYLQSPTLSSTSTSPLREIQRNRQQQQDQSSQGSLNSRGLSHPAQMPPLPTQPLPLQQHPIALNEEEFHNSAAESKNQPTRSPPGSGKPYHCGECKKSFSTQSGFAKHEQLHSNNQVLYGHYP